jgi:aminobenzoyl-glutamate transport protein
MSDSTSRGGFVARLLDLIEVVGNRLPDPITLFAGGAMLVLLLSAVGGQLEWGVDKPIAVPETVQVLDPETGEPLAVRSVQIQGRRPVAGPETAVTNAVVDDKGALKLTKGSERVEVRSLLSAEGFKWVLDNLVGNFTGFHPLGVVLVAMLGIGVAEKTRMIGALLKGLMLITPGRLLDPAMVFIGVMSSLAADAGYVVLPPIAAVLYKAVGRSPLVGIAAVFAGVSAGFSANLVITSLDPLLAGLSTVGAQVIDPTYVVLPTANWWFMIASTVLLTFVGWAVTHFVVAPRFDTKAPDDGGPSAVTEEDRAATVLSSSEKRGLWWSLGVGVAATLACLALVFVPGAPLHSTADQAPKWGQAIVPMLFFVFLAIGVGFGIVTDTIRTETGTTRIDAGLARLMGETMADMAPYVVLAFFAAQFIEFFNHSNLGIVVAVLGGQTLAAADLPPQLLMAAFIMVAMLGNLFVGSASAKYAFFAPVFVPMFMAVGISPELVQAAYRVGDSATNIITPLNPYFVVILVFMQKYAPKSGIGTLVSMMIPYAIAFWIVWTIFLLGWMTLGIDLGPGGPVSYTPPI